MNSLALRRKGSAERCHAADRAHPSRRSSMPAHHGLGSPQWGCRPAARIPVHQARRRVQEGEHLRSAARLSQGGDSMADSLIERALRSTSSNLVVLHDHDPRPHGHGYATSARPEGQSSNERMTQTETGREANHPGLPGSWGSSGDRRRVIVALMSRQLIPAQTTSGARAA